MRPPTKGQYLWVFPNPTYRWMWRELANYACTRTGLRPLFVVSTEEDRDFWRRRLAGVADAEIAVYWDYLGFAARGGDPTVAPDQFLPQARAYERRYGISMMRDMVLGCRHLGRGFILGGQGHPKSHVSERSNHLVAVQTCLHMADFFEDLADRYPPGLMLVGGGGGGVYMKPACLLARRDGIPFRSLVHGRFADLYYWADSEFEDSEDFSRFFRSFPPADDAQIAEAAEHLHPTGLSVKGFAAMRENARWSKIMAGILETYARYAYGRLRGYRLTATGYKPGSEALMRIRQRQDWQLLQRIAPARVTDLSRDLQVVYFPLQTEPEHSINVLSPEHANQLATALELALSLPADTVLAVKEHPYQLGRRTRGFYEALKNIPNVVLMHPDEPSLDIIRRADITAVITSSAGYEAAVLGKPVLHFGRHGLLLELPHVHGMTGFANMDIVREILENDDPAAAAQRRRDGAAYFLALSAFALDLAPFEIHGRGKAPSEREVEVLGESLLKTLPVEAGKLCA